MSLPKFCYGKNGECLNPALDLNFCQGCLMAHIKKLKQDGKSGDKINKIINNADDKTTLLILEEMGYKGPILFTYSLLVKMHKKKGTKPSCESCGENTFLKCQYCGGYPK